MTLERLHKVMAAAGAGSRRECEALIEEGRVTVNGEVVRELGTKVDPETAEILLDDELLKVERPVYYKLNKPRGVISTCHDPRGRPCVVDLVPGMQKRIYPVGRLDADSVGLMLLTNDGALAQRLTHPSYEVEKTYEARVKGYVRGETIERLKKGLWLSDGRARVEGAIIRKRKPTVTDLTITLHEGKNREIRRVMAKMGHPVLELRRVAIGTLGLGNLKPGKFRKLTADEVASLRKLADAAVSPDRKKNRTRRSGRRAGRRGPGSRSKPR